jgi:serine/threonine protein kinase
VLKELHDIWILHDAITPDHIHVDWVKGNWRAVVSLNNIDYSYQRRLPFWKIIKKRPIGWEEETLLEHPTILRYLAPERVEGESIFNLGVNSFQPAGDVFSFGQLAFFMLAFRDPKWDVEDATFKKEAYFQLASAGYEKELLPDKTIRLLRSVLHTIQIEGLCEWIQSSSEANPILRPSLNAILTQITQCISDLTAKAKAKLELPRRAPATRVDRLKRESKKH